MRRKAWKRGSAEDERSARGERGEKKGPRNAGRIEERHVEKSPKKE